jgi:hypothetical protein
MRNESPVLVALLTTSSEVDQVCILNLLLGLLQLLMLRWLVLLLQRRQQVRGVVIMLLTRRVRLVNLWFWHLLHARKSLH